MVVKTLDGLTSARPARWGKVSPSNAFHAAIGSSVVSLSTLEQGACGREQPCPSRFPLQIQIIPRLCLEHPEGARVASRRSIGRHTCTPCFSFRLSSLLHLSTSGLVAVSAVSLGRCFCELRSSEIGRKSPNATPGRPWPDSLGSNVSLTLLRLYQFQHLPSHHSHIPASPRGRPRQLSTAGRVRGMQHLGIF